MVICGAGERLVQRPACLPPRRLMAPRARGAGRLLYRSGSASGALQVLRDDYLYVMWPDDARNVLVQWGDLRCRRRALFGVVNGQEWAFDFACNEPGSPWPGNHGGRSGEAGGTRPQRLLRQVWAKLLRGNAKG